MGKTCTEGGFWDGLRKAASEANSGAVPGYVQAVEEIINDLSDRRGLSHEWDMIDDDVKTEIKTAWQLIIKRLCT